MHDLETFVKHSKYKLIVMYLASILPILLLSSLSAFIEEHSQVSILVMRYLAFILVETCIILKIIRYHLIIGKKDYAENLLIKLNDERNIYIKMRTYNLSFKIILFVNSIVWISMSFVNEIAYYVLFAELILMILTYIGTRLFFTKKY